MERQRAAVEQGPVHEIRCVECGLAASTTAHGWKAYIGGGYEGEPLEVVIYCPQCNQRECGS